MSTVDDGAAAAGADFAGGIASARAAREPTARGAAARTASRKRLVVFTGELVSREGASAWSTVPKR